MAYKTEVFASFDDFLNRADKKINGVSSEFAEKHPDYARDNETNTGCWNCKSCRSCVSCVSCMSCESCESCHSCVACESCVWCVSCKWCVMSEKASLKFEHSINVFGNVNERKWRDSMTNKTEIFASFNDFLNRADKKTNGVSPEFAERNPNYAQDNETNIGCWNCESCKLCESCKSCVWCVSCKLCKSCKSCVWCVSCVWCESCKWCRSCKSCESCVSCVWCESCESCVSCKSCESCMSCESLSYELKNQSELNVPLVQNIHQSVFNAASAENALDMGDWHVCETTHCRAGWVVHLAGKAGYELEKLTSTPFAAMAIYNKSSDIKVPLHMFYVDNDESLADIKRCAELELDLSRPT